MSNDGLLSLRWNNHHSSFMLTLANLRNKENYSDITLACDGKFYSVHKIVLSTCSDYFAEILNRTPCKHPFIVLKDIRQQDLEALLNYMYLGEVNVVQNDLACLIKAAECLSIKGLAVPDEPGQQDEDSSNSEVTHSNESKQKKRRYEEATVGTESQPPVKKANYRLGNNSVSSGSGAHCVQNSTPSFESQDDNVNKDSNGTHRGEQNQPSLNFVIKEEAPVKYEEDDEIQLADTDTSDNLDNSVTESVYTTQRTNVQSESGEIQFENSISSELNADAQNPNIPQQYPMQPQTFEDIVSQAIPGPSLQIDGGHKWDCDQVNRDAASFHLQGFADDKGLPPNHHNAQSMGCVEETYPNMRGSHCSDGNMFQESCNVNRFAVEKQVFSDSRMDLDTSRHAREWRCMMPDCGYVTDRESWLKQHYRKHTGEKPFSCKFCSFRSAQKGNLNVHIKRVHHTNPAQYSLEF